MTQGIHPVPRLIVEVRGGRAGSTKTVIAPGQTRSFGRTELADVAIPHDETLGGVHFDLTWDGAKCRLRDRRSLSGTELDGARVLTARVPHGGWIRAGKTDFVVLEEGRRRRFLLGEGAESDEGDESDESVAPAPSESTLRALSELRALAATEPLYALLDAARDERILPLLRESVEPHRSLYEGTEGDALEDVAPYLAGPMRADSMLLDGLVTLGWGKRWGVYVTSASPMKALRRHFRRFLMVEVLETGEKLYFRFYDPGALREVWPGLAPRHVNDLLEETTGVWHEDETGNVAVLRRIEAARREEQQP
ncbi:MAG: DUF4123 domain-containing protein [Polyangiaceae bacterium]